MDKILKICKHHGYLEAEQVYLYKKLDENGKEYVKQVFCRQCKLDSTLKWQKNKPEKVKEYGIKHKDKINDRKKKAKYYLDHCRKLTDGYVKNVLNAIYKVPIADIPPKAITIKREALRLRRQGYNVRAYVDVLDKIFGRIKNDNK